MNFGKKIERRSICKGLLTFGGIAFGGLAVGCQQKQTPSPEVVQDQEIADAVKNGATMEELAALGKSAVTSPQQALRELKTGNTRFFNGTSQRPEISAAERRAQILGQTPFAVVLGCSDSRAPTEIIFDQGSGSLFITRVAGNIVDTVTVGSIEYAVNHLKTLLVVVMGHEGCGAVKTAMLPPEERAKETPSIQKLLDEIVPSVSTIPKIRDEKAKMREAVVANVRQQVANLKKQPAITQAIAVQPHRRRRRILRDYKRRG